MSIPNYGVIKGTVLQFKLAGRPQQPHLHLLMSASGKKDIAINVLSMDGSEVLYAVIAKLTLANADALKALPVGVTHCNGNDGIAIDYVRTPGLISKDQMKPLAVEELHMHDAVIDLLQRAIDQNATVYQFGQIFQNGGKPNPFWQFSPDAGGHDCHMDQGNPQGSHDQDNGTFQDGALFVQWPDGTWSGLFIAFQSQSWDTDDNGDAK